MTEFIIDDYSDRNQASVFSAAMPYVVGSLAVGAAGTWVSVANIGAVTSAGSIPVMPAVLATAGSISALVGFYCFFATVVTGMHSRNTGEFYKNIGNVLKIVSLAVMTEVLATIARKTLEVVIDRVIFGQR